jgi:hypothetical protein
MVQGNRPAREGQAATQVLACRVNDDFVRMGCDWGSEKGIGLAAIWKKPQRSADKSRKRHGIR